MESIGIKKISAKDEAEILLLIKEQKTAGYIAEKFNTFKHVIQEIAKRNNLTINDKIVDQRDFYGRIKPRNNKATRHELDIIKLVRKKKNASEIAKELNVTVSLVNRVLSKNGYSFNKVKKQTTVLETSKKEKLKERDEKIKNMLDSGASLRKIAKKFKVSHERVRQIAKDKYGIKRHEENEKAYMEMAENIHKDVEAGFNYDELNAKYDIENMHTYFIRKYNIPTFKFFKKKRDEIIVEEFRKGKSASEIVNSNNKFLTGSLQIKSLNLIYRLASQNKLYKFPQIKNRRDGGCFEDKKILDFIKEAKDKDGFTFNEITKALNRKGFKTLTGKKFRLQNVRAKYLLIKKYEK